MTDPSKITNAELRVAIAEKLGWKLYHMITHNYRSDIPPDSDVVPFKEKWERVSWKDYDFNRKALASRLTIPNYPGDPAAALGMVCDLKHPYQITHERVTVWAPMRSDSDMVKTLVAEAEHDNTLAGIARALSEAAYVALKAKEE